MISITERDADRIKSFVREHGGQRPAEHGLRLRVTGGGCDGLRHELEIDTLVEPDEVRLEAQGITVMVARDSLPLVRGVEIDYVEGPHGAGFTVRSGAATARCGCGRSFHSR